MKKLMVGLGDRSYPIFIENGCLTRIGSHLAKHKTANRYCIISDENVAKLYGDTVIQSLFQENISAELVTFPPGEASKCLELFSSICRTLAQKGFDRKDGIIALGGGVTGDLAGYVASSYMRGISFVQVPTSLLAQVDSSVGGKTGVDIPEGKNLVGSFYQPKAVYIDTDVLKSLPLSEFRGGMAEVIKHGVIRDADFFHFLENNSDDILSLDNDVVSKIIYACCSIKADVVAEDEQESNIRRILNYGHTIGHAVEATSNYSIIHGNGVAIGMVAAARISVIKGLMSQVEIEKILDVLGRYGLPTEIPGDFDRDQIKKYLLTDKKIEKGKISFILPQAIGHVIITDDVAEDVIEEVLNWP